MTMVVVAEISAPKLTRRPITGHRLTSSRSSHFVFQQSFYVISLITSLCLLGEGLTISTNFLIDNTLYEQHLRDQYQTSSHHSNPRDQHSTSQDVSIRSLKPTSSAQVEALTSSNDSTSKNVMTLMLNGNVGSVGHGSCKFATTTRRSLVNPPPTKTDYIAERALTCTKIDDRNYKQVIKSIYKRNKISIQQIEITESEPYVVLPAIELICDRFNCSRLTVFNVSSNQELQDYDTLSSYIVSWSHLEVLDLSNTSLNSIESVFKVDDTPMPNLTTLLLDYNDIDELDFNYILDRMPNLQHLSLINNSVFSINCTDSLKPKLADQLHTVRLAGNAIDCQKSQMWFMKQLINTSTNLKFPDFEQINCSLPDRLADMTWSQRVSILETPICDHCECKAQKKLAISVDCHNKSLDALPSVLPLNTKVLNLASNRIKSFDVPSDLKNWENVTYLHLENNLITSFQPLETNSKFLRNLTALDIRRNRIQEFPSHIFEQFTNLDQIHLSNNPWICDCEPTFAFQEWLQRQFHKVDDKEEIKCGIAGADENGIKSYNLEQRLSSKIIYRLSKPELCPHVYVEKSYDWLDLLNLTLSLVIILIVSKVIMDYIYQQRAKSLPHFFKLNF